MKPFAITVRLETATGLKLIRATGTTSLAAVKAMIERIAAEPSLTAEEKQAWGERFVKALGDYIERGEEPAA